MTWLIHRGRAEILPDHFRAISSSTRWSNRFQSISQSPARFLPILFDFDFPLLFLSFFLFLFFCFFLFLDVILFLHFSFSSLAAVALFFFFFFFFFFWVVCLICASHRVLVDDIDNSMLYGSVSPPSISCHLSLSLFLLPFLFFLSFPLSFILLLPPLALLPLLPLLQLFLLFTWPVVFSLIRRLNWTVLSISCHRVATGRCRLVPDVSTAIPGQLNRLRVESLVLSSLQLASLGPSTFSREMKPGGIGRGWGGGGSKGARSGLYRIYLHVPSSSSFLLSAVSSHRFFR